MKILNERWRRNLPNIIALEKKKEQLQIELDSATDISEEDQLELSLQIKDIDNEIVGL